jgi:hypothetical protein
MNEPIVEELYYTLKLSKGISFDNPPILIEDFAAFELALNNGSIIIQMKTDCSSEEQARNIVEPLLNAWELDNLLTQGKKEFCFEFKSSKIIDRNPTISNGSSKMEGRTQGYSLVGGKLSFNITRNKYPSPPRDLSYTSDVESLSKRYEGYLKGKEPLLSMAYFCLTLLESRARDRANAGKVYFIDEKVLSNLGRLTSECGNIFEARKVKGGQSFAPLTESEKNWIVDTIKQLIRRKAEYDFYPNVNFPLITMESLPNLK